MEQIDVKVKRWGNSFGIVLPMEVVNKENLKEGTELVLTIQDKKATTVGELMKIGLELNLPKRIKRSTAEIMKEVDEAFSD